MDEELLRKHYNKTKHDDLVEILVQKVKEVERLELENKKQFLIIRKLSNRVKKAIRFINHYTCKRQYMTFNDEELLKILEKGKYKDYYQRFY